MVFPFLLERNKVFIGSNMSVKNREKLLKAFRRFFVRIFLESSFNYCVFNLIHEESPGSYGTYLCARNRFSDLLQVLKILT